MRFLVAKAAAALPGPMERERFVSAVLGRGLALNPRDLPEIAARAVYNARHRREREERRV